MGVNSLPKTVTRQRHGCDLNPGPSAPESSTLTTRLPSHSADIVLLGIIQRRNFCNCAAVFEFFSAPLDGAIT